LIVKGKIARKNNVWFSSMVKGKLARENYTWFSSMVKGKLAWGNNTWFSSMVKSWITGTDFTKERHNGYPKRCRIAKRNAVIPIGTFIPIGTE
jgi:hypothetical protein